MGSASGKKEKRKESEGAACQPQMQAEPGCLEGAFFLSSYHQASVLESAH